MSNMKAKVQLQSIENLGPNLEKLKFSAVSASNYPEDGSDENNTYAKFSPSASFEITIANPNLIGKFKLREQYYVDFTLVEEAKQS